MAVARQLPLAGKRVVVTRAPEQAGDFIRELEQLGAEVSLLPAIAFSEPRDFAPLDKAIQSLAKFHWLLFTSQNAVRFFAKRCRTLGVALSRDNGAATRPAVAAVGPATAEAAEKEGFHATYVAADFRGEALAAELGAKLRGKRVLLPRSDRADESLPAALRAQGADVVNVVAYRTAVPGSFDRSIAERIRCGDVDVISFLSPSAFRHILQDFGVETLRRIASCGALAAIGPVTAAAIRDAGLPVAIEAPQATAAVLAAAIARHFTRRLASGVKPS